MRQIYDVLVEILKELKMVRKHLEAITKHSFVAGKRFDFMG